MSWLDRLAESSSSAKVYFKKIENIGDTVEIPVVSGNEMLINETYYAMAFDSENPTDISKIISCIEIPTKPHHGDSDQKSSILFKVADIGDT